MQTLRDRIAANLTAFRRIAIDGADLRRAAVAIVLSPLDGQLTYLLTRRALTMRRGAGNYALPGGNFEPGEDAVDAAIPRPPRSSASWSGARRRWGCWTTSSPWAAIA